jgi:multicomponent Na+:H+ antiporter subunit E
LVTEDTQQEDDPERPSRGRSLGAVGADVLVFAAVWAALVGGAPADSWYVAVPTIALAVLTSWWLGSRAGGRIRPWRLPGFAVYFLRRSLVGGVDVALRALAPSRPLAPEFIDYEWSFESDTSAAVFFAAVISLLPGTLCVAVGVSGVRVHVVDRDQPNTEQLRQLDHRVGRLFGEWRGQHHSKRANQ